MTAEIDAAVDCLEQLILLAAQAMRRGDETAALLLLKEAHEMAERLPKKKDEP
jgi:hypothetical protein